MTVFKISLDFCSLLKITSDGHRKIVDTEYNCKDIGSAAIRNLFLIVFSAEIVRFDCQIPTMLLSRVSGGIIINNNIWHLHSLSIDESQGYV